MPIDIGVGHHPENAIDKIDLLKIDAEKSELDIIKGIEDRDWPKSIRSWWKSTTPHAKRSSESRIC